MLKSEFELPSFPEKFQSLGKNTHIANVDEMYALVVNGTMCAKPKKIERVIYNIEITSSKVFLRNPVAIPWSFFEERLVKNKSTINDQSQYRNSPVTIMADLGLEKIFQLLNQEQQTISTH
jgi:hypothetical protein